MQKIEKLKAVEVGTLGNMCTPDMIRIHAYQGVESGKFYGIVIDHCRSGDDQKPRVLIFDDLRKLEEIAKDLSNTQEPLRTF